jgi:hypothetical protein
MAAPPTSTQGAFATTTGRTLETVITSTLTGKGFEVVRYRVYDQHPERYGTELLLTHVPYLSVYGHPANTEFLVRSERYARTIRIECKWQQSSGSVDEKFPYLYINCVEAMPEPEVIIVLDGDGARKGGVQWLRDAAEQRRYLARDDPKKIQVMNLAEFITWANRTFR